MASAWGLCWGVLQAMTGLAKGTWSLLRDYIGGSAFDAVEGRGHESSYGSIIVQRGEEGTETLLWQAPGSTEMGPAAPRGTEQGSTVITPCV